MREIVFDIKKLLT